MSGTARSVAARAIARVIEGGSLSDHLPAMLAAINEPSDRALAQELVYGTLRFAPRLEFMLSQLLDRPVRKREPRVHALLMIGLYQLYYMRVPAHAAVAETVEATRRLKKDWATGLVNAILRRVQREQASWQEKADAHPTGRTAHPDWLLKLLVRDWPDQVEDIIAANNDRAPMTLRVNARRGNRETYLERLAENDIAASAHPFAPDAIELAQPVDVSRLPGFREGDVSVQDAAAQLACELLAPTAGMTVLDACAAPGGKTAHLLEHHADLEKLVAIDRDADRLDRVGENLARLELHATLIKADAAKPEQWLPECGVTQFDRILLDAPCSATGVIRRHPDIKLLRRAKDIDGLVSQQARLLDQLWPLLAPGGRMLYATCSVLADENSRQVANFMRRHPDALSLPLNVSWGQASGFGRQILPGEHGMDGFFYAVLTRAA